MLKTSGSFLSKLREQQSLGPARQRLFYLLQEQVAAGPHLSQQVNLSFKLIVASPQAGGQLESVQPYTLHPLHLLQPPLFLQPEDIAILIQLKSAIAEQPMIQSFNDESRHADQANYLIQPPLSRDWLKALCATQRVLHATHFELVKWCSSLPFNIAWVTNSQGVQKLAWSDPGGRSVLALYPPCYWDGMNKSCGELIGPLSQQALAWVYEAPSLQYHDVGAFLQQHQQALLSLKLPLPEVLNARSAEVTPVPQLRLCCSRESDAASDHLRISYDYALGSHHVVVDHSDSHPVIPAYHDNKLWLLYRDTAQEARFWQQFTGVVSNYSPHVMANGSITFSDRSAWQTFMLKGLPLLLAKHWVCRTEPGFRYYLAQPEAIAVHLLKRDQHWFDVGLAIEIDGREMTLLPLLKAARQRYDHRLLDSMPADQAIALPLDDGREILISVARVKLWLAVLTELDDERKQGKAEDKVASKENEHLTLPWSQLARLTALQRDVDLQWYDKADLLSEAQALAAPPALAGINLPASFKAVPRHYQILGIAWLQQRANLKVGGILADDMGLGKTLQTLAHLALEKQRGRLSAPALVVAPRTVISNWQAEARRFAPDLKCLVMQGSERHRHWPEIGHYDLLLTSYQLAMTDSERWQQQNLHVLILDEAQAIKNPRAKTSQQLKLLRASYNLCLTGTPMENHLGELWSLFDFIMPGLLDTEKRFNRHYRQPIEQEGSVSRSQGLMQRIAPFILRRTKAGVAPELPAKTEIIVRLTLQKEQRDLYETLRLQAVNQLTESLPEHSEMQGRALILNALLQLRQLCCDPSLLTGEALASAVRSAREMTSAKEIASAKQMVSAQGTTSAKREYLLGMLTELVDEGRTILLFSQFTRMLDLISEDLADLGIPTLMLTGKSRHRGRLIQQFQAGAAPVFLISLKAGGTGLNLTRADTVIHYDPWWNSSAEQQATDRAHRIGQDKPVFVYKLLAEHTVEEKIHALQQNKQNLLDQIYHAAEGNGRQLALDNRHLLELLN